MRNKDMGIPGIAEAPIEMHCIRELGARSGCLSWPWRCEMLNLEFIFVAALLDNEGSCHALEMVVVTAGGLASMDEMVRSRKHGF